MIFLGLVMALTGAVACGLFIAVTELYKRVHYDEEFAEESANAVRNSGLSFFCPILIIGCAILLISCVL